MKFSENTQAKLQYYIYCLVNPLNHQIFYIGKGINNRVFDHEIEAEKNINKEHEKIQEIKNIWNHNQQVERYIIRSGMDEHEAFVAEETIIAMLKLMQNKQLHISQLSNIVEGHQTDYEKQALVNSGSVEMIQTINNLKPLSIHDLENHNVALVSVNPSNRDEKYRFREITVKELVDPNNFNSDKISWRSLGAWAINKNKIKNIDYIISMTSGGHQVIGAFKINHNIEPIITRKDNGNTRASWYDPNHKTSVKNNPWITPINEFNGFKLNDGIEITDIKNFPASGIKLLF